MSDFSIEELRRLAAEHLSAKPAEVWTLWTQDPGQSLWAQAAAEALLEAAERLEAVQSVVDSTRERNAHDPIDSEAIEEALALHPTAE